MNPRKVLLVDDDKEICADLEKRLSSAGYKVFSAHSRDGANNLMQQQTFDLAILDIMLPDGNGFLIYQDLKSRFPQLYCIIITGNAALDNAVEAINQGVDTYLLKPFSVEQFDAALQQANKILKLREDNQRLHEENIATRQFFENLLNSTGEAVFVVNLDFDIQYCNSAAQKLLNSDKDLLLNHNLQFHIEDGYKVLNHIYQQLMVGKKLGGYRINLLTENEEKHEVNLSADFLYNQQDRIEGIIITMEITSLQNELFNRILRKEKFVTLTNLANALAHEIRNPINILYGRMQLLRNEIDDQKYQKTFSTINRQVDRISDIIKLLEKFNINRDDTIPETFSFIDFFEDFIREYLDRNPQSKLHFHSKGHEIDVNVEASKVQFGDAFMYLFTSINEIAALPLKVEIFCSVTKSVFRMRLEFSQPIALDNILEPFTLLSLQDNQSSLGLAIMHTIFANYGIKLSQDFLDDNSSALLFQLPIIEVIEMSKNNSKKHSKIKA